MGGFSRFVLGRIDRSMVLMGEHCRFRKGDCLYSGGSCFSISRDYFYSSSWEKNGCLCSCEGVFCGCTFTVVFVSFLWTSKRDPRGLSAGGLFYLFSQGEEQELRGNHGRLKRSTDIYIGK